MLSPPIVDWAHLRMKCCLTFSLTSQLFQYFRFTYTPDWTIWNFLGRGSSSTLRRPLSFSGFAFIWASPSNLGRFSPSNRASSNSALNFWRVVVRRASRHYFFYTLSTACKYRFILLCIGKLHHERPCLRKLSSSNQPWYTDKLVRRHGHQDAAK